MSMAASLEQRATFLDVEPMRFVGVAARAPAGPAADAEVALNRRAMEDLVPAPALARRKHPFATPYDRRLRSELGDEVERQYPRRPELGALIQPAVVSRLVTEHRAGRFDHKRLLYCLLEFAYWNAVFVEGDWQPSDSLVTAC